MKTEGKIANFIKSRPYLVWYVGDAQKLSESSVLEHALNYGSWEDVQKLIEILGKKKATEIFQAQVSQKRNNYKPMIKNYFQLYFKKNA